MKHQEEEENIKSVLVKLADDIKNLINEVKNVAIAQEKTEKAIRNFVEAKKSGPPVVYMSAEEAEKAIKKNLSQQLVDTKVHAEIGKDSAIMIQGLTHACAKYIASNVKLKPRKPLLKVVINNGKPFVYVALISVFIALFSIVIANKKVSDAQDAKSSWGARAYQAALLYDEDKPGDAYDHFMRAYDANPKEMRQLVEGMEINADKYQKIKKHLLYLLNADEATDIRVIKWEYRNEEWWFLYRYLNEETERSVYERQDGEVIETTDRIIDGLASAQKYYTRGFWSVIREAPAAKIE